MKDKFKLIIPFLVLFMIFLVPNVFAATTVNSKNAFKTACQDSTIDVIKLGTDIEITNEDYNNSYPFQIDSIDRTIDLNGHNLTVSKSIGSEYGFVVRVARTGKALNITNSKSTGKIFNNSSHALFEIYNNDIVDFDINVYDITIQGVSNQLFDASKEENINFNVNNVDVFTNTASGSLYFFFSGMKANIRNFTLTRNDTRGSVYICTNWDTSLAKDVIGDSEVYYDDDKQEVTDSTYLYEVYSTTGYKTVSIRDKQYTYSAELEDINLGTAQEGYTPSDYSTIFRMRNTGTAEINASSNYFKTELTSGNTSAFTIWTNNGGYFQAGGSYNGGSIKPKENLTPGTYTAVYTAYYDKDGAGTDYGFEALDTATVKFTVEEKEPVYYTVTFHSNINLGNKLPAPTQVKEGEYVPIETMLSIPMVYNGYSLEGMYSDSTYTTPAYNDSIISNTDYYLKYTKISDDNMYDEIDINFTAPVEGTSTTTPKDGDNYDLLEQENKPQVTVDENDNYYLYNTYWAEGTTEDKIRVPFIGTFDSSKEYYCLVEIDNKVDKYIDNDFIFKVNGQVTNMEYYEVFPFSTRIIFKVTPQKAAQPGVTSITCNKSSIDFGTIIKGFDAVEANKKLQPIRITNNGTTTITIVNENPSANGPFGCFWYDSTQEIAPGEYLDITLRLAESSPYAGTAGNYNGTYNITATNIADNTDINTINIPATVKLVDSIETYKISFNKNGGTGTMADVEGLTGTYILPTTCTFTAPSGKVFAGWSLTSNGAIIKNIEMNENKTVYAIWKDTSGILKGDLDRNGVVDANDASVALELYKAQNATDEDILIGDMDDNDLIDANDASLILEYYKTHQ